MNNNDYDVNQTKKHGSGRKAPQYIAALIASLSALSAGTIIGWTSQISEDLLDGKLGFPLTEDELGWTGSLMPLGGSVLSLFIGLICDFGGRKRTMLVLIIPITVGWCLILCAKNLAMLYSGRFITGMVAGAYCVTYSLYSSEISQKEIRGALGSYTQLMISLGIFITNLFGKFLSLTALTIACGVIPLIFGALFVFMPESPVYWLRSHKTNRARKSLIWLRGEDYDVEREIKEIELMLKKEMENSGPKAIKESLKKSATRRACAIGVGLMLFKVLCGIDAITAYTSFIFAESGMELDPKIGTIILNSVQVVFAVVQTLVVDRLGRKILLLISSIFMTICLTLVGLIWLLKTRHFIAEEDCIYINYIPLVSLTMFTIAFSVGLGPIAWMMLGEIFPQEIKSFAASIASFVSWITAFAVTKLFLVVDNSWGGDVAFFIFAGFTAACTIFTATVIPETKGKTFEEIRLALTSRKYFMS